MLTQREADQILYDWNDTSADFPSHNSLLHLFRLHATYSPHSTAISHGLTSLSYQQLDLRSNLIAHRLIQAGASPGSPVALLLDRSFDQIASILACWKAASHYVPIDPANPPDRVAFILLDSDCKLVVSTSNLAAPLLDVISRAGAEPLCLDISPNLPLGLADIRPHSEPEADSLAYIIYTSGSTGKPKGVMVEHRNVLNTIQAAVAEFGFCTSDRMPLIASYTFDISLFEAMTMLSVGGICEVVDRGQVLDPTGLRDVMSRATLMHGVPSLMRQVIRQGHWPEDAYANIRMVFTGGDSVGADLVEELKSAFRWSDITVLYGPTEAAILATSHRVERGKTERGQLIGRPLRNVKLRIVDGSGRLVPVGVAGEIEIIGRGVSRGYLNRNEETASRYREDRGERLYQTGDIGKWNEEGEVEFLGRVDQQVKIHGYRIELGEVEAALIEQQGVMESAVIARQDGQSEKTLVAYVVVQDGAELNVSELRRGLSEKLPEYMLPAAYVRIEKLPVTANGKLDRNALPEPDQSRPSLEQPYTPARTGLEAILTEIWQEVIGVEKIGIYDNFFEIGGDSIKALLIVNKLQDKISEFTYIAGLLNAPSIAGFAAYLNEHYPDVVLREGKNEIAESIPVVPRGEMSLDHLMAQLNDIPEDELLSALSGQSRPDDDGKSN